MYFLTSEFEKKKLLFSLQSRCRVFEHLSIVRMPCIPNLCRICLTFNYECNLFSQFYLCSIHFIRQAFIYIYRIYLNLNDVQYLDSSKFTNNFLNLFYCHHIINLNIFFCDEKLACNINLAFCDKMTIILLLQSLYLY